MYVHHNPVHEAAAAPAPKQSEVARKLAVAEAKATVATGEQDNLAAQATSEDRRAGERATATAAKRPWVPVGGYLPAACDSFRVH